MLLRVVLFGGKGGVGKSTLACATALKLSEHHKTLLLSIDPAHSLSGILQTKIGSEISKITHNLYAQELSAEELVEKYSNKVLSALKEVIPTLRSGLEEYTKQLRYSPTALETALLDRLVDYFEEPFDFIILDSAPTGQMVRFFYTMNSLENWFSFLEKIAEEKQKLESFMGRKDSLIELLRSRKERVKKVIKVLREKAIIFAVTNEDPLSIEEGDSLQKHLRDFKVYKVINRCRLEETPSLKIPYLENPFGIENLRKLRIDDLVKVIVSTESV
ncbi:ArsA family ATPase [Hydrogenobacter hydrogenophilus]|uniref:arsenite-transporting ATPase n=1 Tax=Hydrogenobacter hydrogenophilus TaxID=35835 RepID=A0A285NNW5_9AQUI|nr:TRC40/GET3/ArsA family transport-energizing ATPase [Hydrogenobacter hydrogenophilus]SNZ11139.1 arsenite-transporting ATPase [Hydrogenobacter hydrogenophilus]